jgi:3-isopropylmalate/(R)-2-methylmalate dehydratase small subunit
MKDDKIESVSGKAVSIHGSDIDTDRIIPARYLKCVSFDGLTGHAFEDDRAQMKQKAKEHPFDNPIYSEAEILIAGSNFGCGSSREHAPQALKRWNKGIRAIVAESFAEIFFGNCTTLGIPVVTTDEAGIDKLMAANESDPNLEFTVDLTDMTVRFGNESVAISMPEGARQQLLTGHWDPTAELLDAKEEIANTAAQLPYFNGWA